MSNIIHHTARAAATQLLTLLMLTAAQTAWANSPWGHQGSGTSTDLVLHYDVITSPDL